MKKTIAKYFYIGLLSLVANFFAQVSWGQGGETHIAGLVVNEQQKPVGFATVLLNETGFSTITNSEGIFFIKVPSTFSKIHLTVSGVEKKAVTREILSADFNKKQFFVLISLTLALEEVEVGAVRKKTNTSNSSIVFDREAIEQSQSLSLANVLNYLPGKTILKPNFSIQSPQNLTLRNAVPLNGIEAMNNSFGISVVMDDAVISNDANMQSMSLLNRGAQYEINPPESQKSKEYRNGTLYSVYNTGASRGGDNGIDLREIPVENIERIEVVSGVASARYGDYTSGMVIIDRQAGVTPWKINLRNNEGTQNVAFTKGMRLKKDWGVINFSFNYLHSNDDPRNKIKSYDRTSGGLIWSYQDKKKSIFKNTLSADFSSTLDRTRVDIDAKDERAARFENRSFSFNNRAELRINKPWLNTISLQGSYRGGYQESYDQYYINSASVKGVIDVNETGIHEGYYIPGYYLAVRQIIGKPVSTSARLETNSSFKFRGGGYNLSIGANYNYNANKGAGIVVDPDRPRFADQARNRPYILTPTLQNMGVYIQNSLSTKIWGNPFLVNAGVRGDIQNSFFTISPRININYRISKTLNWNAAYGIATKSPSISQISPGDTYIDIPLINVYNGSVNESVYLVYTQVINNENKQLRPYRSNTYETGLSYDAKKIRLSATYSRSVSTNNFTTTNNFIVLTTPTYTVSSTPGMKPVYTQIPGGDTNYVRTYNKIVNGNYVSTNGVEIMLSTDKIKAIQTSFSASTAFYSTYYKETVPYIGTPKNPRFDLKAIYGVFDSRENKGGSVKSTVISNTHISKLRMAIILTGEIFWVNKQEFLPTSLYPVGYYTIDMDYVPLTAEQARSSDYSHLLETNPQFGTTYRPSFVYGSLHARLSKEIGSFLRFSFNAYNFLNLRPQYKTESGITYYNGQPSFGAELTFTIK